jgi:Mg-chelatase subunit ChlD
MEREKEKAAKSQESIEPIPGEGRCRINRTPTKRGSISRVKAGNSAVAHEVRLAFESTRYSHDEWAGGKQTGRFRSRDASKAASGELNVFSRRESESSTRVHLALLVDYSGSMQGAPFEEACSLSQTLVEAMDGSQVYRQSVWQYLSAGHQDTKLNRLWITGDSKPIAQALADGGPADSGTPTGMALYGLGHEVTADRRADEAMVILSITDGDPNRREEVVYAVQHWTERGVAIIGVNIEGESYCTTYMKRYPQYETSDPTRWAEWKTSAEKDRANTIRKMEAQYGEGNYILFDGDWSHLAEDIGMIVGRALAGTLDK